MRKVNRNGRNAGVYSGRRPTRVSRHCLPGALTNAAKRYCAMVCLKNMYRNGFVLGPYLYYSRFVTANVFFSLVAINK